MGITAFQSLCDGFCDAAGVPRQQLAEDAEAVAAFSTQVQGVTVNIVHTGSTHPGSAFVLIDFGPPPKEREAEALRALLLANFTMLGEVHASTFSIHPVFGNVTLQATYAFEGRDGAHLLRAVRVLAAMAVQWRHSYFLDEASAARTPAFSQPHPAAFA